MLDVATGTGAVALELVRQKGCTVVGVDQSEGMLETARRRVNGSVELVHASAEQLPFDDGEFDALTFTYLLRYVDDPAATIRELARVVQPGRDDRRARVRACRTGSRGRPGSSGCAPACRRPAIVIGHGWHEVGSFLGPSIRGFYERWPEPRLLEAWRAAGIADVRRAAHVARRRDRDVGTQGVDEVRPAFYALRPGGWRDYVTLLHPPYTAWHLSYVAVGAALAPHFHLDRMLWTLAAFALAMGVAAHALDELNGRPLRTRIRTGTLVALAVVSLAGALAIGVYGAAEWGYGLLAFVAVGAFLVPAYNLELVRRPLPHRLVVRDRVGRVRGADRLLRRGAVDPARGPARRGLRDGAQPGAAAALDAGPPRAPHARRHGRDGAARAGAARADVGGAADRLRARGGAPNLEP